MNPAGIVDDGNHVMEHNTVAIPLADWQEIKYQLADQRRELNELRRNQDTDHRTIANQQTTINALETTIATQQTTIDALETTIATQQATIDALRTDVTNLQGCSNRLVSRQIINNEMRWLDTNIERIRRHDPEFADTLD
ncbi:uncharacterized protein LOC135838483 [Planococcus citri]|uniref:uncharacterized protein LOC135838483 n=1 Tax=Planococcus citri TaxID=170843 RepID=UPI0031F74B82